MVVDFDDFSEFNNCLPLLKILHEANPAFRCTLFAVPSLGSPAFWDSVPDWCELAAHGWAHQHPREAEFWTHDEAVDVLVAVPERMAGGWKSPGWQVSDGTYTALLELDWWIADHWENDGRRPEGLRAHVISRAAANGADPDHWHGHIGNVCGNGIEETFDEVLRRVINASSFEWMSEVVK